ncbi:MAG: helix-turn-helix transcriptional regulator [Clostridiaceae bacterium]|nr:helix-turn-helix transcriptional regulator [Clostridiaceae bacterium]
MEFNEKLQQLRKQKNLTQEQLAEKLYVSRTAISKWESGKGYPSIESLKCISKFFKITIDELLSGEELISIAETESKTNLEKVYNLIYGILDVMVISFIFLPLYGQKINDYIYSVSLFDYNDTSNNIKLIYYITFIVIFILGIVELAMQFFNIQKLKNIIKSLSLGLHNLAILFFIATRQTYVTTFLFMLFFIKIIFEIKKNCDEPKKA